VVVGLYRFAAVSVAGAPHGPSPMQGPIRTPWINPDSCTCTRPPAASPQPRPLRACFERRQRCRPRSSIYKWTLEGFAGLLRQAGFVEPRHWTDPRGWFGVFVAGA
jgi:hypothetical protein